MRQKHKTRESINKKASDTLKKGHVTFGPKTQEELFKYSENKMELYTERMGISQIIILMRTKESSKGQGMVDLRRPSYLY